MMRSGFLVCIRYDEIGPSSSVLPVDVRLAWFFVLALLVPVDIKLFNLGFGAFVCFISILNFLPHTFSR